MIASPNVNVQVFLNENKFSPFQWIVFAICFLIVMLDGFDTAAIGYIAPSVLTEWKVDRSALAPVLSAALFGLAFGAMASGPLADRFGRKAVLLASVLIFGCACLASSWSGGLSELVFWRFVTGLGLGAAMPNAATLMSEYCPDGRRATLTAAEFYPTAGRATGISSMLGIGRFGGVAGPFLVAQLQAWKMGFADIFTIVAIPALIAAAALMVKHFAYPQTEKSSTAGAVEVLGH